MIRIVHKNRSFELDREKALKLELKINLTKRQDEHYIAIGDDLYNFYCSPYQLSVTRNVTEDEYDYLVKLNAADYDKVVIDPKSY
jgi:hypothetical protein